MLGISKITYLRSQDLLQILFVMIGMFKLVSLYVQGVFVPQKTQINCLNKCIGNALKTLVKTFFIFMK